MTKSVAVLGATGLIGQQFIRMLENHPWLKLESILASPKSKDQKLKDRWNLPFFDFPETFSDLTIDSIYNIPSSIDIVFSGLPAQIAKEIEPKLRQKGMAVLSNASAFRMDPLVPILIPEINGEQSKIIEYQKEQTDSSGFIVTNANCTVTGAAIYLGELIKHLQMVNVIITSYQALSGAGNKGVSSLEISNNVIPFINGEELKVVAEAKKILGKITEEGILQPLDLSISANCARVNVVDGHLEAISAISNDEEFNLEEIIEKLRSTPRLGIQNSVYSPKSHLLIRDEVDRPQPQKDVFLGQDKYTTGMSIQVGRLRKVDNMLNSFVLVHNTIRGGAGGSLLNAEYLKDRGYL